MTIKATPDTYTWARYLSGGQPVLAADSTTVEHYAYLGGTTVMFRCLAVLSGNTANGEAYDFQSDYPSAYVNVDASHRYARILRWYNGLYTSNNGIYIRKAFVYGGGSPIPKGAPHNASASNMSIYLHQDAGTPSTINTTPIASATSTVPASASLPFTTELTLTDGMHYMPTNTANNLFLRLVNGSGVTLNSGLLWVDLEAVLV